MKDTFFFDFDDFRVKSEQGKFNEMNSEYLLNIYSALIRSYQEVEEKFTKQEIKKDQIADFAFENFTSFLRMKVPITRDNFVCNI